MIQSKVLKAIKEYDRIIIHGHIRPDGDCYGAQFGLKSIINNTYKDKEVYVVGGKSDYVSFLGSIDEIEDSVFEGALSIIVDCATLARVEDQRFNLSEKIIKIDHHICVEEYGDIQWVELVSSASQMVASLLIDFPKLKIDNSGAIALYTGIVTDTGRFRFQGVDGKTMKIAGLLVDKGAIPSSIDNKLNVNKLAVVKFKGYALSHLKTTPEGFVYFCITNEIKSKFKISEEEAANIVGALENIEGFPIWAVFIQYEDEIRVRLRSNGPRIDLLANKHNGGGHALASGARINSFDDVEDFAKEVDDVLIEWKNLKQ